MRSSCSLVILTPYLEKCVQGVLKKIIEFWQENQEDVISMQRVLNIARKINTAKQEVSKLWDKIAKL